MSVTATKFSQDFQFIVQTNANSIAIIDSRSEEKFTYAMLEKRVSQMEEFLSDFGFDNEKRLLMLLPNSFDTLLVFLAVARMGGTLVPQSTQSTPPEIENLLAKTQPDFALIPSDASSAIQEILDRGGVPFKSVRDIYEARPTLPCAIDHQSRLKVQSAQIFLQTSGTTGEPRTMVIEIDRLWESALAWVDFHKELNHTCRFLNYLPHAYLGGLYNLCLIPIAARGSFVVTDTFSGTSLLSFWSDVERFDVNAVWLVPSILRGLLTLHERTTGKHDTTYKKIKFAFIGTAPIDTDTKEIAESAFGFPILENFALSETTFLTSERTTIQPIDIRGVGSVLPYVDLRIVPNGDSDNPEIGEIFVRTPFLFSGYLQNDGTINLDLDSEGYWPTGDIGKFAEDGHTLLLNGRRRDIIKKGGYMISLNEVENVTRKFRDVEDAAAIAVPHTFYGEDIALFVTLKTSSSNPDESDIRVWLSQNLAKYKWPSTVKIIDELPRTKSGKVQKFKLINLEVS